MKFLGNLVWFLLGGWLFWLVHFLLGIICCVTIILIPFGKQYFKIAKLVAFPFGKIVDNDFDSHPYINIIWMFSNVYALLNLVIGAVLCITIIGIPFGKQCFKIARLSAAPFGAVVV